MKPAAAVLAPYNLPARMRLLVQMQGRRFQDLLKPFNLTPLHWGILCCLWQEDGLATQAITLQLEQLGGTVTVGLDVMEKRGLVRRRPDPKDRRVSRVWLTSRSDRLQNELVPQVGDFIKRMFGCFSTRELAQFNRLTERLRDHVEHKLT